MFTFHACGCAYVSGWFWCESISGHPMQKLRSFCRVYNALRMLRCFIFLMHHPLLLRKHKQASGERCRYTWSQTGKNCYWIQVHKDRIREVCKWRFCFSSNLASNVSQFGILMITTFRAVRSFPCPPSDGNRSPQSVTPHDERAFGFFWANRACHFLKWLIAFIQVLLLHLSRAFCAISCFAWCCALQLSKKNRAIMFLLDTNRS